MNQIAANQLWVVLRDTEPVSWLWDGWVWTNAGERLNLYGRFQTRSSISELAALVTDRSVRHGADLPAVEPRGEQPLGSWPQRTGGTG